MDRRNLIATVGIGLLAGCAGNTSDSTPTFSRTPTPTDTQTSEGTEAESNETPTDTPEPEKQNPKLAQKWTQLENEFYWIKENGEQVLSDTNEYYNQVISRGKSLSSSSSTDEFEKFYESWDSYNGILDKLDRHYTVYTAKKDLYDDAIEKLEEGRSYVDRGDTSNAYDRVSYFLPKFEDARRSLPPKYNVTSFRKRAPSVPRDENLFGEYAYTSNAPVTVSSRFNKFTVKGLSDVEAFKPTDLQESFLNRFDHDGLKEQFTIAYNSPEEFYFNIVSSYNSVPEAEEAYSNVLDSSESVEGKTTLWDSEWDNVYMSWEDGSGYVFTALAGKIIAVLGPYDSEWNEDQPESGFWYSG